VEALQRFVVGVRLIARRHRHVVWLLWALVALVLLLAPVGLLDPAAWSLLVDPELAAIAVLLGVAAARARALRLFWRPVVAAVARVPRRR